jgi:hypothetical protein
VLTIPENFADFSNYPEPVLNAIRRVITASVPVQLEAPGKVSLFAYDNGTFIVHNFRNELVNAAVTMPAGITRVTDLVSGESVATEQRVEIALAGAHPGPPTSAVTFRMAPHAFRAFKIQ